MYNIPKDPMTYKTYLKNSDEITIKLRIIKHRIVDKEKLINIAFRYSMHRNSVRNIMLLYESFSSDEFKKKIKYNISFSKEELITL